MEMFSLKALKSFKKLYIFKDIFKDIIFKSLIIFKDNNAICEYSVDNLYLQKGGDVKRVSLILIIILLIPLTAAADPLKASWYSVESLKKEGTWRYSNGTMADGSKFRDNELTCASRDFDLGNMLIVTNLENGRSVRVRCTDRINKRFAGKRIDLSKGAFRQIADLDRGLIPCKVKRIK